MKRWFVGLLFAVLMVIGSLSIYAAPGKVEIHISNSNEKAPHHLRSDARYIIHRSAMVLFAARRAAEHRHQYFGLARAFAHQKKARELYVDGTYREAIFHSLRARNLAFQIIKDNRERPDGEYYRDDLENRYEREAPKDHDLDMRIDHNKVGRDDDVGRLKFDIDIQN